jgi:DnaJ-class molecular chaperone
LIQGADEHSSQPLEEKGSTVHSAWKRRHDHAEDACPKCQGSTYVPGPMYEERMVDECPECKGTGKDVTKKAA